MKVTIEVYAKEKKEAYRMSWDKEKLADHGFSGRMAIKVARAIRKMEREK